MAARKNMGRIEIYRRKEAVVLNMGEIEIWDGADLSLLRDALVHVIEKKHARSVAIDMTHVKYVPSGFFGMLYDWFEKGVSIYLIEPQEHVMKMLWFKRFFKLRNNSWFLLSSGPSEPFVPDDFDEDEIPARNLSEPIVGPALVHQFTARSL